MIKHNNKTYKNTTELAIGIEAEPRLFRSRVRKYGLNMAIELSLLTPEKWLEWKNWQPPTPSVLGLCAVQIAEEIEEIKAPPPKQPDLPPYDEDYELKNKAASLIALYGFDGAIAMLKHKQSLTS